MESVYPSEEHEIHHDDGPSVDYDGLSGDVPQETDVDAGENEHIDEREIEREHYDGGDDDERGEGPEEEGRDEEAGNENPDESQEPGESTGDIGVTPTGEKLKNGCCTLCIAAFAKNKKPCRCQVPASMLNPPFSEAGCFKCGCRGCNPSDPGPAKVPGMWEAEQDRWKKEGVSRRSESDGPGGGRGRPPRSREHRGGPPGRRGGDHRGPPGARWGGNGGGRAERPDSHGPGHQGHHGPASSDYRYPPGPGGGYDDRRPRSPRYDAYPGPPSRYDSRGDYRPPMYPDSVGPRDKAAPPPYRESRGIICRDFQRGRCTKKNCKYEHVPVDSAPPHSYGGGGRHEGSWRDGPSDLPPGGSSSSYDRHAYADKPPYDSYDRKRDRGYPPSDHPSSYAPPGPSGYSSRGGPNSHPQGPPPANDMYYHQDYHHPSGPRGGSSYPPHGGNGGNGGNGAGAGGYSDPYGPPPHASDAPYRRERSRSRERHGVPPPRHGGRSDPYGHDLPPRGGPSRKDDYYPPPSRSEYTPLAARQDRGDRHVYSSEGPMDNYR